MSEELEELLSSPPFSLHRRDRSPLLLSAMNAAFEQHFAGCPAYRRYCERRGVGAGSRFTCLEEIPFLPVQAFKENADLLSSVATGDIRTQLRSSATSGVPSVVNIDALTAKRQVRALVTVLSSVLGPKRRPFIVLDVDPQSVKLKGAEGFGARGAALRGFLNFAREAKYFMTEGANGLAVDVNNLSQELDNYSRAGEPVVVFGFTFVLYVHVVMALRKAGRSFSLPEGSFVVHIGGWKKLEDQKVDRTIFNETTAEVFGVPAKNIVDFYGFTEQMGITYPDDSEGRKCTPCFADVIVRDPVTFEPLPDGREGLLEFLTPIPHSYPGIAVLTDDLGVIDSRDSSSGGWHGTRFRVTGRAKQAEIRGCGDIMAEKVSRPRSVSSGLEESVPTPAVRVLCAGEKFFVPEDITKPIASSSLPEVEDIAALASSLKTNLSRTKDYSVDDLITLISAAAERWIGQDAALAPLRQQGLLFLSSWCRSAALRQLSDRSLRGSRGYLDGFRPEPGTNKRMIRAVPRGLVAHWLSGNVPLLGMLTVVQSMISGNANILKAASTFSGVLPALLRTFAGLEVPLRSGRVLRGDDILGSTAVVYFPRENLVAAEQLSLCADVRLAWGGREAVESIMNLPKCFGTDDVIFGPKLSFMVIGKESLSSERQVRKFARRAAIDASVFDQYACASPHTIFVESGGALSPREFAAELATEMDKALFRIPKAPPDAGTVAKISSTRMRYEFEGELWSSKGSEWTVLFDEKWQEGLAPPCYSRVITVRSIPDALSAAEYADQSIQTIGLALSDRRRVQFAERAAKLGSERFPDIGRMTFFDSPWDGMFAMDRFVRWVSLGGPF